jgi:hypothetical protein
MPYDQRRECCRTFINEEHSDDCPTFTDADHSTNCSEVLFRSCCVSKATDEHTLTCTSNEAVLGRANPPDKREEWAAHRELHGDPLADLRGLVERVAPTHRSYTFRKSPSAEPIPEAYDEDKRTFVQVSKGIADRVTERLLRDPAPGYKTVASLCEICQNNAATFPRARPRLLVGLKARRFGLEGIRPLKVGGRLEALQIAWLGWLVLVVPGPAWGERADFEMDIGPRLLFAKDLGPLTSVQPWVCFMCRMSRQTDVSARTHARWTVKSYLGRQLQMLGQRLSFDR